jgi:SAM-dependent methyltransferase
VEHIDLKDAHLRLQAEMSFGAELAFYELSPAWSAAATVVDLGCGNGAYTALLARAYPEKRFIAVDTNRHAVRLAQETSSAPNVEYRHGDAGVVDEDVDVVLSRFCLMYIDDLRPVAELVERHVRVGVVQIDNDDASMRWPRELAPLVGVLPGTVRLRKDGAPRTAATTTEPVWRQLALEPAGDHLLVVTSEPPFSRERMLTFLVLTAQLVVGAPLPADLLDCAQEWYAGGRPFQYGIRVSWFVRPQAVLPADDARAAGDVRPPAPDGVHRDSRRRADHW